MEIYRNIPRPPSCRAAGTWPPGWGAAGPPPLYKGVGCPSPSFALLKIQKKEKRGTEGEAKRRSPVGFSSRRL